MDHTLVSTGDLSWASVMMAHVPSVPFKDPPSSVAPDTALSVWDEDALKAQPPADPPLALVVLALSVLTPEDAAAGLVHHPVSPLATIPDGFLLDLLVHDRPSSPVSTISPFGLDKVPCHDGFLSLYKGAPPFLSVSCLMAWPRMLGFQDDSSSYARIIKTAAVNSGFASSLIDGGANICVTRDVNLFGQCCHHPSLTDIGGSAWGYHT